MSPENRLKSSGWDRLEQLAKILSFLAIPVLLAIGGWVIQHTIARQSVDKDYVQLAVSILTDTENEQNGSLRKWAVELLNQKSSVKFSEAMVQDLQAGTIKLPGAIYSSRGIMFDAQFIEEIFSKWESDTKPGDKLAAMLIVLSDDMMNHHWHKVATYFEPDYYYGQLTLLGEAGRLDKDGLLAMTKQFIKEAMYSRTVLKGAPNADRFLDLDTIKDIHFLDIQPSWMEGNTQQIKFQLTLDDGTILSAAFVYDKDTLFFQGAWG